MHSEIEMRLVTVILPNYNHEPFLQNRLDSIFNQTYQNFEVIILDDASSDNSLSILNQYKTHPKVLHFIENEVNSGSPFKQWKKGLELAKGDFIWIAESDDFCDLNFLETQITLLQNSNLSVAKTMVFNNESKGKEIKHPAFRNGERTVLDADQVLYCPVLNVSAAVFKIDKSHLNSSKFDQFQLIGDRVFYHEFFFNKQLVYNPHTQSYFRQEEGNLSNLDSKDLNYLVRYFNEHVSFINLASKTNKDIKKKRKDYIVRFYNRVRHRLSRKDKFSLQYFKLYIYYLFQLF